MRNLDETDRKLHSAAAWGSALLAKCGIVCVGMVCVYWIGWPQPPVPQNSLFGTHHSPVSISGLPFPRSSEKDTNLDSPILSSHVAPADKVNINTGTRVELEALPGIGPVLATRIMVYREEHGAFERLGNLTAVSGIGTKRLQRLQSFITVGKENLEVAGST